MTAALGGRYQLRGVLGRGGMAEVHDGWDTRLSRPVAVKLLYPALAADEVTRRRFENEARAAAALNHPNIVAIHDSGEDRGTPYIVMERLPGPTLADEISAGPLSADRVRWVLNDLLGALTAAHDAGILHRDIKPGNVLITKSGAAKLADFGIAKTDGAAHTRVGMVFGTANYLSPQRITGQPASPSDDLYALGVLGYEALTRRLPFERDNPVATMRAVLDEPLTPIGVLRPDVDPALIHVLERAMSRDPAYRFANAAEMRAALQPAPPAPAAPLPPTPPATLMLPPPPAPRRSRVRMTLLTGGLLAGVVLAALLLISDPPPQRAPITPVTTSVEPTVPAATDVPGFSPTVPENEWDQDPGKGNGHGNGKGHGKKGHPHE
ncbi:MULTISPECIES: serine/threonine-protein kinase [Mycolicibacterium]|uniref:non-specific serine/threonine protein kinase n=1 Tax=Mycolicibacterium senegalense TaxID=1796 RepID=A0A378WAI6_9MYCO|nr:MULTISPECIES: serine/threonine-protein kinase [Mycolicibacterium]MCV7337173.1 serine/threonine protein kinase [Mycolicibacterium senegalense]MDR7287010.1 serine/threonine-protein kinase [Mycolicibacterium senegalense]QZA24126.1 serine/threonine protein kinase [Mycolicibacterium senegalense]CDP87973.1 serine/threonine protein kinase [Mycolicibacterium farcinogenes]SUA29412.1 serine/threonine protein kinase [Mycolicibacterium senegalense]